MKRINEFPVLNKTFLTYNELLFDFCTFVNSEKFIVLFCVTEMDCDVSPSSPQVFG